MAGFAKRWVTICHIVDQPHVFDNTSGRYEMHYIRYVFRDNTIGKHTSSIVSRIDGGVALSCKEATEAGAEPW